MEPSFEFTTNKIVLQNRVDEMKKELCEIMKVIENNTELVKESEAENLEYKKIAYKLKENIDNHPFAIEYNDPKIVCNICSVF